MLGSTKSSTNESSVEDLRRFGCRLPARFGEGLSSMMTIGYVERRNGRQQARYRPGVVVH